MELKGHNCLILIKVIAAFVLLFFLPVIVQAGQSIALSQEEQRWIVEHPVINVAVDENYPFSYIDGKGRFAGMSKEYLDIVSKRTGLKFHLKTAKNWDAIVELVLFRSPTSNINSIAF